MRLPRGFTLIELLVVLAIVGLLVGVTPMAFERLRESAQYRDTLRTMVSELRQGRARAQSEGTEIRFQVDLGQRTYGLEGRPPRTLPAALQLKATVASREMAGNEQAAIRFLPDGGATGGSIDVVRKGGAGTRLRVDWLSGRVTQEPLVQ